MHMNNSKYIIGVFVLVAIAMPSISKAYLDPGTMSYFIQALVAILAGVGYAVKIFWSQIKRFFARIFGRSKNDGNDSAGVS